MLLGLATVRPVFVWGAPGMGKSSLVRAFAYCGSATGAPAGAPVLVIMDGWCDVLRVRREHAYPIPQGARLPFTARGPVFRVR